MTRQATRHHMYARVPEGPVTGMYILYDVAAGKSIELVLEMLMPSICSAFSTAACLFMVCCVFLYTGAHA